MTTVAANRQIMAADSKWVTGDVVFRGDKIFTIGRAHVGVAGHNVCIQLFLNWLRKGARGPRPDFPTGDDADMSALVLTREGLYLYDMACVATEMESFAIGSGTAAALGAMRAGKGPAEAVAIACDIDCNSGGPVVVKTLDDLPRPIKRRSRR